MKADCPYDALEESAFWRSSVSATTYSDLVPQGPAELTIENQTKIASAGSCFAQHIARALQQRDFTYLNAEPGPELLDTAAREVMGYGLYSARFGNIYSTPQLAQLIARAYGEFEPIEPPWFENGAWLDPFRPSVQPGGFSSERRMLADRDTHFAAVRTLFESVDVFVFTMGLTEVWRSREDGAVFPVCPGCSFGTYDKEKYEFANLTVADVVDGFDSFLAKLKQVNPRAEIVLTVSPVPLIATFTGNHVVEATTYSKSVLRLAAEELRTRHGNVHYFASYEIITGARRDDYFGKDLREVSQLGVDHVMRAFFALFAQEDLADSIDKENSVQTGGEKVEEANTHKVVCDEEELAKAQAKQSNST